VAPAEKIVEAEAEKFCKEWARRRNGPVIDRLQQDVEAKRREIVREVLAKFDGKLSEAEREYLERSFRLFANRILHGPISALREESHAGPSGHGHTLLDALRKLFRLED
jgi:glutamyl-tRNA reductase